VAIKENFLSLPGGCRIAFEFGIDNRIMVIVRVQHLRLSAMLFEQLAQECGAAAAVLSMIWSGGYRLERYKLLQRLDQLILGNLSLFV
jgi:hypothetical protein